MLYKLLIVAHNEMWARKGKIKAKVKKKKAPAKFVTVVTGVKCNFPKWLIKTTLPSSGTMHTLLHLIFFFFKRQLLFWAFLEHSSDTGKKILGWISFILFMQKKKKSFTKNYWNQLCTIFTVQKCNWKGLLNCVFYICIILKTPDVFCGGKVTVNQNTILKWGTLIVIILAWNTLQSHFTVMKFLLFSS